MIMDGDYDFDGVPRQSIMDGDFDLDGASAARQCMDGEFDFDGLSRGKNAFFWLQSFNNIFY